MNKFYEESAFESMKSKAGKSKSGLVEKDSQEIEIINLLTIVKLIR
jgi:hypothetical protein